MRKIWRKLTGAERVAIERIVCSGRVRMSTIIKHFKYIALPSQRIICHATSLRPCELRARIKQWRS